jgi:flagellar motor switch protein FliG
MMDFAKIERLPARDLQNLLREVPHRDIAISLKAAEEPVRQRILENVSERKLEMVTEDISHLPQVEVSDVEAAQARILKRLEELYPEASNPNQKKPFTSRLA